MNNESKQPDERAAFDNVKPLVDEWIRSRATSMNGESYAAALQLAAHVVARATTPHPVAVAGSAWQAPITKEWCMKMAALEPEEGVPSAGLAALNDSTTVIPVSPDELAKVSTAPSLTTDAGAVLSDLQRATIQAAADSAHRVLIAGGDGGDELSDAGLRRELKESRDMLRALLAAHPTEQRPDPSDIQGWAVTVNVNTVDILTIGHNSLSGIDNIGDFAEVVRNCAKHLTAFIGDDGTEQRMSDAARECEWTYDDVDFKWDSACGLSWQFNDDGPVENGAKFCHGCGKKIAIAARKAGIERSGGEA